MAKWSTLNNGEETGEETREAPREAPQEKSAWQNERIVQESPAGCGWLATTLLRWIVKNCCLIRITLAGAEAYAFHLADSRGQFQE
ncbi:hypothetical protein [Achromobacter spanius]|uniref:hypothetical protein n=1 Tax=Achromobacter spanius TaxID=217203 RepID=UPI000F841926|nr:hypothetical protein [Achromobacter spanius]